MSEETTTRQPSRNAFLVPIAIVLSAALIAGAIIYSGGKRGSTPIQVGNNPQKQQQTKDIEIAPVTEADHIYGNPNAPIMIVEYSDFDCPFCKNFHETMQKIMETYGTDGKVAWVYRHFPIAQLHPNSAKVSEASECVASLGGNDAFWKFADLLISDRGTNEPTNIKKLPEYATQAGVDVTKFNECVAAGTFKQKIEDAIPLGIKAGADNGTPHSVMMVGDQQGVINGAQPYATVKSMIDTMLSQIEGSAE